MRTIADYDGLVDVLLEEVEGQVVDSSFDYEYGSIRGTHHEESFEIDTPFIEVDVTDMEEIPQTVRFTKDFGSKGDPGECAANGRKSCGGCRACEPYEVELEARLSESKLVDGRKIASYTLS